MSSPRSDRAVVLAACAASLAVGGPAVAADAPDTTISVSSATFVAAPAASPIDFPGVSTARRGRPLPKGYVAVARDVRITRGRESAQAAFRMTCPKGRTWRTGGASGEIGAGVLDRRIAGKRSVLMLASAAPGKAVGETAAGRVYALCR